MHVNVVLGCHLKHPFIVIIRVLYHDLNPQRILMDYLYGIFKNKNSIEADI